MTIKEMVESEDWMLEDKIDQCLMKQGESSDELIEVLTEYEEEIEKVSEEIGRLQAMKKKTESYITLIRETIRSSMASTGQTVSKGEKYRITLGLSKGKKLPDVIDESGLSDEYFAIKRTLNKKKLIKAIESGEALGIELVDIERPLIIKALNSDNGEEEDTE